MTPAQPIPKRLSGRRSTPFWIPVLLLVSGILAVPPAFAVDSRKVEKMIEDALPEKEQALSA